MPHLHAEIGRAKHLHYARAGLLGARERLATFRRLGCLNTNDRELMATAERNFLAALDEVWEAQSPSARPHREAALDLAWNGWLARVETESGRDIANLDSAYIAHRNGQTASDYALELQARAAERAVM